MDTVTITGMAMAVPTKTHPKTTTRWGRVKTAFQRSRLDWIVRAGAALLFALVGYTATKASLATALPATEVEYAATLAPGDARIAGRLAQLMVANTSSGLASGSLGDAAFREQLSAADALARKALRRDLTVIPAIATIGMAAQFRGNQTLARRWFAHAESLSRRDLPTELWLIEDAVQRQDVAGALKHYDTALRTSKTAPDILFPVLISASTDPAIAHGLVTLFAKRPPWADWFLDRVAKDSPEPTKTAQLFAELQQRRISVPASASATLIGKLITANEPLAAWNVYSLVRQGAPRRRSRDPNFAIQPELPTFFDWVVADPSAGISADIQQNGATGMIEFSLPASVGGAVVEQGQVLTPGTYLLTGKSQGIGERVGYGPYWRLTCTKGGQELGRVEVAPSAVSQGRFQGYISVPSGCLAQTLSLFARASSNIGGTTGRIEQVQLVPVGRQQPGAGSPAKVK